MAIHCHNTGALPVARLNEIRDMLTLAQGASESPIGYSHAERDVRSYARSAQRSIDRMIGGAA